MSCSLQVFQFNMKNFRKVYFEKISKKTENLFQMGRFFKIDEFYSSCKNCVIDSFCGERGKNPKLFNKITTRDMNHDNFIIFKASTKRYFQYIIIFQGLFAFQKRFEKLSDFFNFFQYIENFSPKN